MKNRPDDDQVLGVIKTLVDEERSLHTAGALDPASKARLETLRVQLDQYWDLLRQRRALREFGEDPNRAEVRSSNIVEHYEQ